MSAFFRALADYFAPPPARALRSRRQQALSSTTDAFALPHHADDDHRSDDDDNLTYAYPPRHSSYDIPPASSSAYSDTALVHRPRSPASSRSRPAPLLPLHHSSPSPLSSYPPLQHTWARLQAWLSSEYTELGDTLNYGCLPDTLADVERQLGWQIPPAVRESYLVVDGQEPESSGGCAEGLFFGLTLLPLEDVLAEWLFWREVDQDPHTGASDSLRALMRSVPPNWVRTEYSCRGWLPLLSDHAGNYLGVDLDPGQAGIAGQVIIFGRDFDTKVVLRRGEGAAGWANWLASFVEDLESGEGFELAGQGEAGSDGSEDDIGYESYFFNPNGGSRGYRGTQGGPGLRLAGEYKGWNVLEAWADRSIRSWTESGLGFDAADDHLPPRSVAAGLGLAVFAQDGGGAEIPIPVLAEEEAVAISPVEPGTASSYRHTTYSIYDQPTGPPTISVTVPPPQPLELPTKSDLNSSLYRPLLDESSDNTGLAENVAPYRSPPVQSQPDSDEEVSKAGLLPLPVSTVPSPEPPVSRSRLPPNESSPSGSSARA